MTTLDLDGTLLNHGGGELRVNHALISRLAERLAQRRERVIAICTNQGGLPFGVAGKLRRDGFPYPTPAQFQQRMRCILLALARVEINVVAVRVSIFHPYAKENALQKAARQTRRALYNVSSLMYADTHVYTRPDARKPAPLMLRSVGASEYWGDSDEDEGAALAAGVPFVRVARFT